MAETLYQPEDTFDRLRELESELAVTGLAAQIEAHNDGRQPFGITYTEPVPAPSDLANRPPTPKWCNQRQSDGSWASVIDGTD